MIGSPRLQPLYRCRVYSSYNYITIFRPNMETLSCKQGLNDVLGVFLGLCVAPLSLQCKHPSILHSHDGNIWIILQPFVYHADFTDFTVSIQSLRYTKIKKESIPLHLSTPSHFVWCVLLVPTFGGGGFLFHPSLWKPITSIHTINLMYGGGSHLKWPSSSAVVWFGSFLSLNALLP